VDLGRLGRRFEALFRLDPAAAARAPELAREATPARSKIVVDALSLARTAASQAALAAIARDPATAKRSRGSAVQYLAHQEAPSTDVVSAVVALLDDADPELRQMARLTYGAFARSLRPAAAERARGITQDLLGRLDRASAADERAELVVAIGNTGAPEAWPVLRRLATSGAMRERAQAIEALRFVNDPGVEPFLTEILRAPGDESVRLAVIGAVRFRDPGPYASALADVARNDPAAAVRTAALSVLGDRLATLPALRPVLEQIRAGDGAAGNRALAARYLDRAGR
jgi:HEAT repeat protein